MSSQDDFSVADQFGTGWFRLMLRGGLMLLIGSGLVIATLFKHDVIIFQVRDFSWLPMCAFVLLAVGLLECFDAFLARDFKDFFVHLQNGVLDVVVAALIILSIGTDPARLSLLISAFLIVKGIFRLSLAYKLQLAAMFSTSVGSIVSVILGLLIWSGWPVSAGWFLALCLSAEIALRGWAMAMFALGLKELQEREPPTI